MEGLLGESVAPLPQHFSTVNAMVFFASTFTCIVLVLTIRAFQRFEELRECVINSVIYTVAVVQLMVVVCILFVSLVNWAGGQGLQKGSSGCNISGFILFLGYGYADYCMGILYLSAYFVQSSKGNLRARPLTFRLLALGFMYYFVVAILCFWIAGGYYPPTGYGTVCWGGGDKTLHFFLFWFPATLSAVAGVIGYGKVVFDLRHLFRDDPATLKKIFWRFMYFLAYIGSIIIAYIRRSDWWAAMLLDVFAVCFYGLEMLIFWYTEDVMQRYREGPAFCGHTFSDVLMSASSGVS